MTATFEELEQTLSTGGPEHLTARVCELLRERNDYHGLFYGLLLQKRVAMGLPAVQVSGYENIPPELQQAYEDAIREAARTVGQLYLEKGDIPGAWPYYRMINEPAQVAAALENVGADNGELTQQLVEIALHHGVNPRKGFDLVLQRFGICSAITTMGQDFPASNEDRLYCVGSLVRALYQELHERLSADIAQREGAVPTEKTVRELMSGRDWLFEDDFYHIDVSHLGSVVRFSLHLPPGEELNRALELCEYGARLSPRFQGVGDPPFENQYHDYLVYLRALAGQAVEEGIAHFQAKAENADPEEIGTYPAEVLVNLLVRLERPQEATRAYTRFLGNIDPRRVSCPNLEELCRLVGDYQPLVEVSNRRGDLVSLAAGLLQQGKMQSAKRSGSQV
jgi:hypothetical protein